MWLPDLKAALTVALEFNCVLHPVLNVQRQAMQSEITSGALEFLHEWYARGDPRWKFQRLFIKPGNRLRIELQKLAEERLLRSWSRLDITITRHYTFDIPQGANGYAARRAGRYSNVNSDGSSREIFLRGVLEDDLGLLNMARRVHRVRTESCLSPDMGCG